MSSRLTEILARLGLALMALEALLVVLSWLLSATRLEGVRSLLSSEGVRWFFGSFTGMLASEPLVWLLLGLIALGCLRESGVARMRGGYRRRMALRLSVALAAIYAAVLALLTLMPHAILLSATGQLFPSAFSRSLVPALAFGVCLFSVSFGVMSGRMRSLGSVLDALSHGIRWGAPLLVVLILLIQLAESLRFVFG